MGKDVGAKANGEWFQGFFGVPVRIKVCLWPHYICHE